jgi:hypothetical protein
MKKSGEATNHLGTFRSFCCGDEVLLIKGESLPECKKHSKPTFWILIKAADLREKKRARPA